MITQKSFQEFISGAPNASLVIIYALSRYHEKYSLTSWCLTELEKRGFSKNDIANFDSNFTTFYDTMLKQEGL